MSRKKIDVRIRKLIRDTINSRHRSMFFIYGAKAQEQAVFFHHLLIQYRDIAALKKPSLLWCFKKEVGFNIYQQKKMLKQLKKKYSGNGSFCKDDLFQHFLLSSDVKFCHYSETYKVLGQTFGMLIIQDFEALTPNLLARVIECVEGGGMIVFLLQNLSSLNDLFFLNMDSHSRFVTEAHPKVNPRFNKRFVLSLMSCYNSLVLDDNLNIKVLPEAFDVYHENIRIEKGSSEAIVDIAKPDLSERISKIFLLCHTQGQRSSLLKLVEALENKDVLSIVSLTSGRGRGKSALLGLAVSLALCSSYSNVYLTSPHLENLQTLFSFLIKGLIALNYVEGVDYDIACCDSDPTSYIAGIKIFREQQKTVSYLLPIEFPQIGNADLVIIDEAAAIPLPLVKKWIYSCTVFMASTVNGYEGTGRSLSLKLISQLQMQSRALVNGNKTLSKGGDKCHVLHEMQLNEAIRYKDGDNIEEWLNQLLCLNASVNFTLASTPISPEECELYYVDRDVLFGYSKVAERVLQQIVSLFVSSHYKNSPNDLMMMADAPAHHIFCLLPLSVNSNALPTVLCVIQVSLEGKLSNDSSCYEQSHGRRASGDLIPWIISQQFQEKSFPSLSGARVVRIATHPDYQKMGYGQKALQLLTQFYNGTFTKSMQGKSSFLTNEKVTGPTPLLSNLKDIQQYPLDYIGVSYGLTTELFRFWKKAGFAPLYIRQTASELTGEHSCIMIKNMKCLRSRMFDLQDFFCDFTERFASLLITSFKCLPSALALSVFQYKHLLQEKVLTWEQFNCFLPLRSLQRLNAYCLHQVDYHLILDLMPTISKLYFLGYLKDFFLSSIQEAVLLCMGLQNKSVEETATELNIKPHQIMGCFRKTVKRILQNLNFMDSYAERKKLLLTKKRKRHLEDVSL